MQGIVPSAFHTLSLHCHCNPIDYGLLIIVLLINPFYKWRNWGTKNLTNIVQELGLLTKNTFFHNGKTLQISSDTQSPDSKKTNINLRWNLGFKENSSHRWNTTFQKSLPRLSLFESCAELVTWPLHLGSRSRCVEKVMMSQALTAPDVPRLHHVRWQSGVTCKQNQPLGTLGGRL